MSKYEPNLFVEPLGYQPVEFLDIPPMYDPVEAPAARRATTRGRVRTIADGAGRARGIRVRSRE